MTELDLV